jgi:ADP-ribosyl-[dinitrogen reductase] hydrolase
LKSNREFFNKLIEKNAIRIKRGMIFDSNLPPKSMDFDFNKVEGMLLGVAIGDSLGITSEGMLVSERKERFGKIRDYIPNRYVDEAIGFPSDDTQLTFWTLEQMIVDGRFVPDNVARRFLTDRIFGLGSSVRKFLQNYCSGAPWHRSGPASAGNGALMRISPVLIPHLKKGGTDIWVDTALCAMMTHNDTSSISACVAFVAMLWELLDMDCPPDPQWWLERYVEIARDLENGTVYTPRGGQFMEYNGPAWQYVQEKVSWANELNLPVVEACNAWYSGAFLLETLPSVIYILMRHGHDPEKAIVRAVNDTKDNDTIAAIIGAAVGALHGKKAIPQRWIENLSGRTTNSDDGRIFELIEKAKEAFWS